MAKFIAEYTIHGKAEACIEAKTPAEAELKAAQFIFQGEEIFEWGMDKLVSVKEIKGK